METLRQSKFLFKVLCKSTFSKNGINADKRGQKIAQGIAIGFGVLVIMVLLVVNTATMTVAGINDGSYAKIPYMFVFMSQFVVLFFGTFAAVNIMYLSKDAALLSSLPLKSKSIFTAKFALTYVSELLLSTAILIPSLTTFAITCLINGIKLNAGFFILELVGAVVFPVIPLLLISLLSLPLMYVVAYMRKRTIGNAIAIIVLICVAMAVYLGLIGGMTNMVENVDESGQVVMTNQLAGTIDFMYWAGIFNKPFIDAMFGYKIAINLLIYIGAIIGIFAIVVLLSSVFYKKAVTVNIEGLGTTKKRNTSKRNSYVKGSLKLTLLKKEIKTLANTPMMLVNSLMGVVMVPLMLIFIGKGMSSMSESMNSQLYLLGFATYLTAIFNGSSNLLAVVGFSREGKNLYFLKSLPLSATTLMRIKLFAATLVNCVVCLVGAITLIAILPTHEVLPSVILVIVSLSGGFGANCIGLLGDMKNPNLHWQNTTELTKNNKRMIKPALIIIGVGFVYFILGIVFSTLRFSSTIGLYFIYLAVCLAINALLIVVAFGKLLREHEKYYHDIE